MSAQAHRHEQGDKWLKDGEEFTYWHGQWRRETELVGFQSYRDATAPLVSRLPTKPGRYHWSEWDRVVEVGIAPAYNWRRPSHSGQRTLCVLPFPGFPMAIKISNSIAGIFHGPV